MFCWTQLSCQHRELLEGGATVAGKLTLSDHMRGLDPGEGRLRSSEGFEALYRPGQLLDEAMVLLHDVVEVFDLQKALLHKAREGFTS